MTTLSSSDERFESPDSEVPSLCDQFTDLTVPLLGQSDVEEINAWIASKDQPPAEAYPDELWAQEMMLRDLGREMTAQRQQVKDAVELLESYMPEQWHYALTQTLTWRRYANGSHGQECTWSCCVLGAGFEHCKLAASPLAAVRGVLALLSPLAA